MSKRLLYFYILGNFSTVISGVLAYAFNGVSGKGGLSGWQWYVPIYFPEKLILKFQRVFLVEGLVTVVFGILLFFLLPDCELFMASSDLSNESSKLTRNPLVPPQAKWLTEKEKAFVQARLPKNAPRESEKNFDFREIVTSLKDVKMWLFTFCWAFFTVGTSGLTFYQPTVVANLGFT